MVTRCTLWGFVALLGLIVAGCNNPTTPSDPSSTVSAGNGQLVGAAAKIDDDDDEEEIPLDQVPQHIKDAALAAVPGLVLEGAEKETENGVVLYCLEGKANGQRYEVEVSANGAVIEIEQGDDDDDDD